MLSNKNLHDAKMNKKDKFFTLMGDIEKELKHYEKTNFENKVVYCNCDTTDSNFYKYFKNNFKNLNLKKLVITAIAEDWNMVFENRNKAYKLEYFGENIEPVYTELVGDENYPPGDFRSKECIQIAEQADLIITNPPFSLFREFIKMLQNTGYIE